MRTTCHNAGIETRAEGDSLILRGVAIPYRSPTVRIRGVPELREQFDPPESGGFSPYAGVGAPDVVALVQHDMGRPLARMTRDTLILDEQRSGLHTEFRMPQAMPDARNVYEGVESGAFGGLSAGFRATKEDHVETRNDDGDLETVTRNVRTYDLVEVSVVAIPAYRDATVESRADIAYLEELEKMYRDRAASPHTRARTLGLRLAMINQRR